MNKLLKLIFFIMYLSIYKITHAETRKVVAIVDTGMPRTEKVVPYLCNMQHYDVTGLGIDDVHGHATNVTGVITKSMNVKTHCILIIKWWHNEKAPRTNEVLLQAVKSYVAILDKIRPAFINLSLSGNAYISYEANVLKGLINTGSVISIASGNEGVDMDKICNTYPGCYNIKHKNFHVVGAKSVLFPGRLEPYSNYGKVVTDYRRGNYICGWGVCMNGTSQATAVFTSELISGKVN